MRTPAYRGQAVVVLGPPDKRRCHYAKQNGATYASTRHAGGAVQHAAWKLHRLLGEQVHGCRPDTVSLEHSNGGDGRFLFVELANQIHAYSSSCGCGLNSQTAIIGNNFAKTM